MSPHSDKDVLSRLAAIIAERADAADEDASYTAKLLAAGKTHCARKFGEESIELVVAGLTEDRQQTIAEAADVIYHMMVFLQAREIAIEEVLDALASRFRQSGLDEKASRASVDKI